MEDINKYIGIPHVFNGDTLSGADCIGLCRLFYCDHGWKQDFRDGKEVLPDWQEKDRGRLMRYLKRSFAETKDIRELCFGDIVLFKINGDYHLGIYTEYNRVLAMEVPYIEGKTISTLYKPYYWMPFFVRGYRRCCDGRIGS